MVSRARQALAMNVLLLALASPAAAQTFEDFFNDDVVHDVRLDIRAADWALLKLHYLENTYYPADFHWQFQGRDVVVANIGIRSRGRGSRSPIKPNIRIDFNRFEDRQKFLTLSAVVMKANNQDASFLKERIIFNLFRKMGLPASRVAHARLFINSDYDGLYLMEEEIRKEYLERYLGEGTGDLYKWNPLNEPYHFEWRPTCANSTQLACGPDSSKWTPFPFDPEEHKTTFDVRPTIAFVRAINETADADFARVMAGYTDLKLWVVHNALEVFAADFDSILGDVFGMNNFFLYRFDGKNFSQFLLWDKDGSFESSQRSIFQNTDQNVLMRKSLAIPERRYQYLEALYKSAVLAGGAGGWMEWENQREYDQVKPAAYADPNKQITLGGVQQAATNQMFEEQTIKNAQFARERFPFVMAALRSAGFQPPGGPTLSNGGAVNAATNLAGPLAAGSLVSLYGSGLANTTAQATSLPLPATLGNASVFVNGFPAPLLFVSPNQINLQVPWELGLGDGTTPFTVIIGGPAYLGTRTGAPVNGTISNTISAGVGVASPGVFAIVNADGSLTSSKPAGAGDVLVVYANGLGAVDNPVKTGQPAPGDKLSRTLTTPTVTIGNVPAQVLFSGLAPGFVGLYQINITVPAGVAAGSSTPLVVSIGGQTTGPAPIATR